MVDLADVTDARLEIEEKLRRIEKSKFTPAVAEDCAVCGELIPKERQIVTGGTDICVPCLKKEEMLQKVYR